MQTQYEETAKAEETIRKIAEAFNKGDFDTIASFLAPDITAHWYSLPEPLKGRETIVKTLRGYLKAFPDMRVTLSLLSKGDTVVTETSWSGTHRGPLEGPTGVIPPTNRRVNMTEAEFFRFNTQGQVAEWRAYGDNAAFAKQLGLTQ